MMDLEQAKSVCILYSPENSKDAEVVTQWGAVIGEKQKQVTIVEFQPSPQPVHDPETNMNRHIFTIKDCNCYGKPRTQIVQSIINEPYDLLIDLTLTAVLPVKFIAGLSRATCKVGQYQEVQYPFYDLFIRVNTGTSLNEHINQINHYLSVIHGK